MTQPDPKKLEEYKANFLWGSEEGSLESLLYDFANALTEEYRKEIYKAIHDLLKEGWGFSLIEKDYIALKRKWEC